MQAQLIYEGASEGRVYQLNLVFLSVSLNIDPCTDVLCAVRSGETANCGEKLIAHFALIRVYGTVVVRLELEPISTQLSNALEPQGGIVNYFTLNSGERSFEMQLVDSHAPLSSISNQLKARFVGWDPG